MARLASSSILISFIGIGVTLLFAARWLKLLPPRSFGLAAVVMTQPALLAWGQECFGCGSVDEGYAAVYPLAMTAKVMLAQIILIMVL